MLWNCGHCGCRAIAASLQWCPQCYEPREEPVSAATHLAAAEKTVPPEAPAEAAVPAPPPPVSAPKAEHVSYVAGTLGVPEDEAQQLTKPALVELARAAPVPAPAAKPAPAPAQSAPAAPAAPAAGDSAPDAPGAAESGSAPPGAM